MVWNVCSWNKKEESGKRLQARIEINGWPGHIKVDAAEVLILFTIFARNMICIFDDEKQTEKSVRWKADQLVAVAWWGSKVFWDAKTKNANAQS